MIKIIVAIIILSLNACFSPQEESKEVELQPSYTLSFGYNKEGEPRLKVDLSFEMPAHQIALQFPGKYSAKKSELIDYIEDLLITSSNTKIINTADAKYKILRADPGAHVNISYLVKSYGSNASKIESFNAPIISAEYLSFVGSMIFIMPIPESWERKLRLELNWQLPSNFPMFSSFGEAQTKQILESSLYKLREAVFVGGTELRIIKNTIHDKPVTLALMGYWEHIKDNNWNTRAMSLLDTQRSTWRDFDFNYYVISLWAYGESCIGEKDIKYQGRAHYNAIRSKFGPACQLTVQQIQLLSHELMHAWLGYEIRTKDFAKGRFLTEGWTDYYGWLFAVRAKQIELKQYFDGINNDFVAYQSSPEKNTSLSEFEARYNEQSARDDLFQLPYWQGHIMALRLNKFIKLRSNFIKSFDDVIKDLLAEAKKDQEIRAFSIAEISAVVDKYAGPGIFAREYAKIVNGELLELPELEDCADLLQSTSGQLFYKLKNVPNCSKWLD